MNIASAVGFILCFGIMLLGIATNGGIGTIINFIHVPSMLVTFGGAFLAVLASCDSFKDYFDGLKSFGEAFKKPEHTPTEIINQIIDLSNMSRREGILSLEDHSKELGNPYMEKGIGLIVDGTEPEFVRDIMETELNHKEERNYVKIHFWEDLGSMGPAWGMIGTLLGLINMLKGMSDSSASIGPGMSLALITTLYGSILANWICAPLVRKLKKNNDHSVLVMELTIEGILSIQAGENPRVIKEKLWAFIENGGKVEDSSMSANVEKQTSSATA